VAKETAKLLAQGKIVGWFQGKMEFGPRALGSRSILADPSDKKMKRRVNKIKKREEFRPFAPSVLEEHQSALFTTPQSSPFMSFTLEATKKGRSAIAAATHIDFTGRLQTVKKDGSLYRKLIEEFYRLSGIPAILNTSFNSSWEPIVENPEQALASFYSSEMEALVMGNYIIKK
jgi:carbamoyltransferase